MNFLLWKRETWERYLEGLKRCLETWLQRWGWPVAVETDW